MLKAIQRASASDQVFETLKGMIITGLWGSGEILPSERSLCEQLAVGRTTVREAIRGLQALGLVVKRHGKGTFVTDLYDPGSNGFANWSATHSSQISDLLALRYALEPVIAMVAARRADETAIGELSDAVERMRLAISSDEHERIVHADVSFHYALANAARNPLFPHALDGFLYLISDSCSSTLASSEARSGALNYHEQILEAVEGHDEKRAQVLMIEHLGELERILELAGLVQDYDYGQLIAHYSTNRQVREEEKRRDG
jgi:DNA-binding FadR family transcriptional regulator